MEENGNNTDIRARYEFLIAGIMVLLLCMCAFAVYRVTNYIKVGSKADQQPVSSPEGSDGAVLIEVEITQETGEGDDDQSLSEAVEAGEVVIEVVNEHDNILIFTTTETGNNYYKSREGSLPLYGEPAESDGPKPALVESRTFEVIGFSRDGWAAIMYGGSRYYVKSADIVQTEAPEDAAEKHVEPENTQKIRFFTPTSSDDFEYVATRNATAFRLPDVFSSGNKIDLKPGDRAIVVAKCGNWNKIIFMNAEYYVLGALESREQWIEENPDAEIKDNTGYPPAGSPEAASSAAAANGLPVVETTPAPSGDDTADGSDSGSSGSSSQDSSSSESSGSDDNLKASGQSFYAKELLDLVNQARADEGLDPLTWSDTLAGCAAERAAEIPLLTNSQIENHLRPNGKPWYTVNGYDENNTPLIGENIACGQTSAQAVFDAWMASEEHRENILKPEFKTFGAALFKPDSNEYEFSYYWIEEFGY